MEKYIVDGGIQLIKIWLEVSDKEQKRRFEARMEDPLRQWKLSPMDLPSRSKWFEYSRARDMMLEATDTKWAPWYILRSDDKKRARLNCIRHILDLIPYKKVPREKVKLPKRSMKHAYDDQSASFKGRKFVPERVLNASHQRNTRTNMKRIPVFKRQLGLALLSGCLLLPLSPAIQAGLFSPKGGSPEEQRQSPSKTATTCSPNSTRLIRN